MVKHNIHTGTNVFSQWEPYRKIRARPAPDKIPKEEDGRGPGILSLVEMQVFPEAEQRRLVQCDFVNVLHHVAGAHQGEKAV